ncbi:MAG TPA: tetratricopeptide repeat protein [Methanotrichaceae archaeon]|nr:tetratricopeptide repeat protein [Methanotrichaceae archaeon]
MIPENLKIGDERLAICLGGIKEAVKGFWDPPLLQNYTRHGPDHSERIVTVLGDLLEGHSHRLNDYERFILLASVYLHDIGMQSPRHAGLPKKSEYSLEDMEIIRKNHNEATAKIIIESISPGSDISLGLEGCKVLANYVVSVCRYHRSLDLEELKDTYVGGKDVKLPLLAALLRLGDELDADYRRVNMEVLKMRDIPAESKYHWWAHHYVQSVSIKNGTVELYFRYPEEYKDSDIIEALRQKVVESVQKQYFEVYDILDGYGIRLYRDVKIAEEEYLPAGLELVPTDLMEYIDENVLKLVEQSEELSRTTGVTFYLDGVPYSDDAEVVKCIGRITELFGLEKTREALGEIERCRTLMMGPKDRMTFSLVAGNCYYILGNLIKAENYYDELLKISERVKLLAIYKKEILTAKANALGNIGLIYIAKGELDQALKCIEEALKVHKEIGHRQGEAAALGNIGLIYRDKGEPDQALKYIGEALKIDKVIGDRQGEARQLGNVGLIYQAKGKLYKALKYIEEALKVHKEVGYRQGEANSLGNIGLIYRDKGELNLALKYLEEALKIDKEIGYRQGEIGDLGNIGLIYQNKGELDHALKYLEKALKIGKEIGYRKGEANQLGNIGLIYHHRGELDQALKYYQEVLKIDKEIGYRQGETTALGNIGLVYRAKGETDQALKYLEDALEIEKDMGHRQGEANILGNIGLIYMDKGDLDRALKYLEEALKVHKEVGYRQGKANALGNIGLIYHHKGDLDQALKYYQEVLKVHKEVGYRQGEANQLGNIGLIYMDKGDLDRALKYLERAQKIEKELGHRQGEATALGNIGLIYRDKGELDQALKCLKDALEIFKISAPQYAVKTLNNISNIYFEQRDYEKGFEYLGRGVSSSTSLEQINNVLFNIWQKVKEMINKNDWENLEKVNCTYTTGVITDETWVNFFKAIHEYAIYKEKCDDFHRKIYEDARNQLNNEFRKLLNELLEVKR